MAGYRHVAIGGSVGRDGANRSPDVRAVQQLLNTRRSGWSWRALRVDGICGGHTIRAIAEVQRRLIGLTAPDARIDPNGPTLRTLNAARAPVRAAARAAGPVVPPTLSGAPARPPAGRPLRPGAARPIPVHGRALPADVIEAARRSQERWHVPAPISIAQWILESGEGRHMPPGSNNPFGIKAVAGQPAVVVRTREETRDGRSFYIRAPFRRFASLADAFDEHGRLLAHHPAYAAARRHSDEPDAYADALTGKYATDTHYGSLLKSIMRSRDLYRYAAADLP